MLQDTEDQESFWNDIFFIYDTQALESQEDDPALAVVAFYPRETSLELQVAVTGQLVGTASYLKAAFGGVLPTSVQLDKSVIALLPAADRYLIGFSSAKHDVGTVKRMLSSVLATFLFFHRDWEHLEDLSRQQIDDIFAPILMHVRCADNLLRSAFDCIPTLSLPSDDWRLHGRVLELFQSCARRPGYLAGCIVYDGRVVYNEFINAHITALLTLNSRRPVHTSVVNNSALPDSVQLCNCYVSHDTYASLSAINQGNRSHSHVSAFREKRACAAPSEAADSFVSGLASLNTTTDYETVTSGWSNDDDDSSEDDDVEAAATGDPPAQPPDQTTVVEVCDLPPSPPLAATRDYVESIIRSRGSTITTDIITDAAAAVTASLDEKQDSGDSAVAGLHPPVAL